MGETWWTGFSRFLLVKRIQIWLSACRLEWCFRPFDHLIHLFAEACSCGPRLHHGLLPPDFHDAQCFQCAIAWWCWSDFQRAHISWVRWRLDDPRGSGFTFSRIWSSQKCRAAFLFVVLVNNSLSTFCATDLFWCNIWSLPVDIVELTFWTEQSAMVGWWIFHDPTLITRLSQTMIRRHVAPWECCSQLRPAWLLRYFWCSFVSTFFFALDSCRFSVASCLQGLPEPAKSFRKFSVMLLRDLQHLAEDLYYPWPSQPIFLLQFPVEVSFNNGMIPRFWWPAWTIIAWL